MKWAIFSCFFLLGSVQCEQWIDLGCWKDVSNQPTMRILEGKYEILDGKYIFRTNPIQKCMKAAESAGFQIFALQEGECRAGAISVKSYQKHGISADCDDDGTGGRNANHVYMRKNQAMARISSLGCWNVTYSIPTLETELADLNDPMDVIQKCAIAAASHGYEIFAIRNGKCLSSINAKELYKIKGQSSLCPRSGIGADKAVQVYEVIALENLELIGCWREPRLLRKQPPTATEIAGYFSYHCINNKTKVIQSCIGIQNSSSYKIIGLENQPCVNLSENVVVQHRAISQDCIKSDSKDKVYEVYKTSSTPIPLSTLGCWKKVEGLIPPLEGTHEILQDDFKSRSLAIQKCAKIAYLKGYDIIALTENGKCLSSVTAGDYYKRNGSSTECNVNEKGSGTSMNVYQLNLMSIPKFNNLGCWRDYINRAIPTLEGKSAFLDGRYWERVNPFDKCVYASTSVGYNVFSLQNGGWCASSPTALQTYRKYGKYYTCMKDGEGGGWGNQVYEVKSLTKVTLIDMGCWNNSDIPTLEGLNPSEGVGNYLHETETVTNSKIQMCAKAAFSRGYTFFAMQSGQCMASENAGKIYRAYGKSTKCLTNGTGGPNSYQVYKIKVVNKTTYF